MTSEQYESFQANLKAAVDSNRKASARYYRRRLLGVCVRCGARIPYNDAADTNTRAVCHCPACADTLSFRRYPGARSVER